MTDHLPTARIAALRAVLADERFDRRTNLLRLQGWRDEGLAQAVAAPALAHRIGPLVCGALALAAAVTGSAPLIAVTLATALIGVVAPNHPAEALYNRLAARLGTSPLPANRAAKRLGCAVGSAHLAGAWIATVTGHTTIAAVLLVSLGSLALFVAATGICVPSIMFALQFGTDRGTARHLVGRAVTPAARTA